MTAIVSGTKISGFGGAANAVEKQFEHVVKEFPDIAGIHQWGTLNIVLNYPLRINNPDYTTTPIEWTPGQKEQFSLTKIGLQLVPQTQQPVDAWIYVPHGSPHRGNALHVEILTRTLAISNGDQVLIYLPPYRYSSCLIL
jgi:hypothetical protein